MNPIARSSAAVMALCGALVTLAGTLGGVPVQTVQGTQSYEQFGTAVALADVNGDGKDDLIVGSPYFDDGAITDAGRVTVYLAGDLTPTYLDGVLPTETLAVIGGGGGGGGTIDPRLAGRFGETLCRAGDVDGDGVEDVIVGAPGMRVSISGSSKPRVGRLYVYFGGADGLSASRVSIVDGPVSGGEFTRSLAGGSDLDEDGRPDVVATVLGMAQVRAYSVAADTRELTLIGTAAGEPSSHFGIAIAAGGDVNGDGKDDLAVGAPWAPDANAEVRIYSGVVDLELTLVATVKSPEMNDYYGGALSISGDVNGDGIDDLAVGARDANGSSGAAYLHLGGLAGPDSQPVLALAGAYYASLGSAVLIAGDVNDDGCDDLIVAARGFNNGSSAVAGKVYLYRGRSSTLRTTAAWQAGDPSGVDMFGWSLAAGDVNGDGSADVAVGSLMSAAVGRAFVYAGAGDSPPSIPTGLKQLTPGGAVVAAGGIVASSVTLAAIPADPDDSPSRVEIEVRNVADDAWLPVQVSSPVGDSGQENRVTVTGLPSGASFRWRARTVDPRHGLNSAWTAFGTDAAAEVDFQSRSNVLPQVSAPGQELREGGVPIAVGGIEYSRPGAVRFRALVSDADPGERVRLEVEVRPLGEPFRNVATATSADSDAGTVVTVDGEFGEGAYHWQLRAVDLLFGSSGGWTAFGGNGENAADFEFGLGGSAGPASCAGSTAGCSATPIALLVLAAAAFLRRG